MIPAFTIITTLVTIGVTALLIGILIRINSPQRERQPGSDGGAPLVVDNHGSDQRQDSDRDASDGGSDGGE